MTGGLTIYGAIGLPLVGALLIAALHRQPSLRDGCTLLVALMLPVVVLPMIAPVIDGVRPALAVLEILPGVGLQFEVEPLGMLFASVASLLWPINTLYSLGYMRANREDHQTRFYICFAIALSSTMGIAFSGNLLTLFIFYELLTLSTYPLVAHKQDHPAIVSGRTYLGLLIGSSIGLLLPAILWTWHLAGTLDFAAGGILAGQIQGTMVGVLLVLFIFGTGKAALMPLHRWLPAAMVAPTPVSALLHAVAVVKAGVFTVVKILIYIFGLELLVEESSTHWLLYIAALTILVASVIALRQDNLKLRLAYSTISQLAYVILAAAVLAPLSAIGAALHIAAHAFGKITLFFAAGSIYTATHRTRISQLNGIGRVMPWTMTAFCVGALSMIGVPPAAGFLSKWYILIGAFDADKLLVILVIIASTLLNTAYFVPIIYAAFLKEFDPTSDQTPEESHRETAPEYGEAPFPIVAALMASATLTLLLFFFPDTPLQLAAAMVGAQP